MPDHIIRQPDGRYAIFSTVVDAWTLFDATKDELVEHYEALAAEEARRTTRDRIARTDQFGDSAFPPRRMSFDEADQTNYETTGKRLADLRSEVTS